MFAKHLRLKRFLGGIVVTAAVAVVAAPSALSSTSARGGSVPATVQGYRFITDTLGGNRHRLQAEWTRAHVLRELDSVQPQQTQGYRFITDTLGGNRHNVQVQGYNPSAYVPGGATPAAATAIQGIGHGRTPAMVHGYNTSAYVPGGASPTVATAIQDFGYGRTAGPVVTGGSSGTGINWRDAGFVALAAALLLLLLGGLRLRTSKPDVRTA